MTLPKPTQRSLHAHNTFGFNVRAEAFLAIDNKEEVAPLLTPYLEADNPIRVLGGGSNILFTQNVPHLLVHPTFKEVQVLAETESHVTVSVEAGFNWHQWVLYCLDQGWYGLENLSLIPGNVGAAPIQNIGAYGVEVKDYITWVQYFDYESKTFKKHDTASCQFGYRNSIFKQELKNKVLITEVAFTLPKKPKVNTQYGAIQSELERMGVVKPTPQEVSKAVIAIRESKLPNPKEIGNAGSFFKNPVVDKKQANTILRDYPNAPNYPAGDQVKLAAGWLIEQCGWKGKKVGAVGVHSKQALVLVNHGEGTGKEIYDLSQAILESVAARFGITLEREVNVW